ncbi:sodium channel protein Nach [Ooceraea biroi]|nr:sodium channel protein Nach [Ooceraea biroi]
MTSENGIVTSPEMDLYPTWQIDFPAIAICNVNRISRKAANHLAQELAEFESVTYTANLTVQDLTRMLTLLGQLYLYEFRDAETILLHTILERACNSGYDVDRIMKHLAPKCRNMLWKCTWQGKEVVCDDIFVLRKTQDGYCCTFNYARRNDGFGSARIDVFASQYIEHMSNIGPEYGLSVLLDPELDDYFYKILPINGFKVLLYNPMSYPDVASGRVREVIVSPRIETYLKLDATLFYTTEDAQKHDIQERDCLFQTEESRIFHGYYSFSDCIMYCRMQDILRLCGCVPFFYPMTRDIANASTRACNLKDLFCLRKYKEKWQNVKPRVENNMTPFNDSMFEGIGYLSCNCFPSCTDITYNVKSNSIPLSLSELYWGRSKYSLKNHSVLHIFFGKLGMIRLRQDVLYYWHDLMSIYVNIWNLFLGVSIINVIEMIYKYILFHSDATSQLTARMIEEKVKKDKDAAQVIVIKPVAIPEITARPAVIPEITQPLHWEELTGVLRRGQLF